MILIFSCCVLQVGPGDIRSPQKVGVRVSDEGRARIRLGLGIRVHVCILFSQVLA